MEPNRSEWLKHLKHAGRICAGEEQMHFADRCKRKDQHGLVGLNGSIVAYVLCNLMKIRWWALFVNHFKAMKISFDR